jgi:hypothetical protein
MHECDRRERDPERDRVQRVGGVDPTAESSGAIMSASTGSPMKPSAMLAIVMPSWVAAIASSRRSIASAADCAPRRPSATHSSICVLRTATSANSVATK